VYPCAALLNHSCAPNCVLRYELGAAASGGDDDDDVDGDGDAAAGGRYHPPILAIVACRDVMAGEGTIGTFGPCGMDCALTGGKVSPNGQSRAWCECE